MFWKKIIKIQDSYFHNLLIDPKEEFGKLKNETVLKSVWFENEYRIFCYT